MGRPGSGKSNLLHVFITSVARLYSPAEVQFYLIDFKKGVEFKCYATHRLPHARVVAISSRRLESCQRRAEEAGLQNVAFYTDYEKALAHEGVDIVSICTPQQLHPENTIAAAEAGKHIVIEKAIANTPKDMSAMPDAVDKAGVKTVVSFVLRWNPLFTTIKTRIADDAIGDGYYTEADYQHDIASWWTGYEEGRTKALGVSARPDTQAGPSGPSTTASGT